MIEQHLDEGRQCLTKGSMKQYLDVTTTWVAACYRASGTSVEAVTRGSDGLCFDSVDGVGLSQRGVVSCKECSNIRMEKWFQ